MAKLTPPHLRSLYRALLRELPPTRTPTPLHSTLRESFTSPKTEVDVREATELLTYLRAQRMYATLLERYNPSLRGGTEDRVRLSARRVGLEMPKGGGNRCAFVQ